MNEAFADQPSNMSFAEAKRSLARALGGRVPEIADIGNRLLVLDEDLPVLAVRVAEFKAQLPRLVFAGEPGVEHLEAMRAHQLRTLLTMLGIIIAIASVVAVVAVHNSQAVVALAAIMARIAWVVITTPGAIYQRRMTAVA
ncbi:MAG TPA: hypothetical protein PKE13_07105 [Hyphomicrobium zavarzinii]|nr:hypothetical protein [Hyphomicrobium zavarzinii]